MIDLQDTGKSRYFAVTLFNNCFITWSPSLFSYLNQSLSESSGKRSAIFHKTETVITTTHEQNIICSKTRLRMIRPLLVGMRSYSRVARGGLSANEKEEKKNASNNNSSCFQPYDICYICYICKGLIYYICWNGC